MPLKVQDSRGNEWLFQFRFWTNNKSRMYVLEGIFPYIQSMHLQAGDIVTFSRIEPEGKLVMGCRKVSAASPEKGTETPNAAPKSSSNGESVAKGNKAGGKVEYIELAQTNLPMTGYAASPSLFPLNQQTVESTSAWNEADKPGHVGDKANASVRRKKKNENGTVGLRRKRLKIDNEDVVELKVTWEQVQGLFRPPPNQDPTVNVIDGCVFEEFSEKDAPVIGRPTIPASDGDGKRIQWIQCEKCFKWRKVPVDALLKSKWTCSDNFWDTARSMCSADEELTSDKLDVALLPAMNYATSERMKDPLQQDPETVKGLEGLGVLADLAQQENATSSQTNRTKHPRHKPGCSCIVCLQPPCGKWPTHSQTCDCVVCNSQKRRFKTLMRKRGQMQSGKGVERGRRQKSLLDEHSFEDHYKISRNGSSREEEGSSDNDNGDEQSQASSLKGHIDLNNQPDREEELSAGFHSVISSGIVPDTKDRLQTLPTYIRNSSEATLETMERNQRQQKLLEYVKSSVQDGIGHTQTSNSIKLEDEHIVHPCISSSKGIMTFTTPADSRSSSEATLDTNEMNQKLLECVRSSVANEAQQQDGIGHTYTSNSMQLENKHIVHPCIALSKGVVASTTPAES